MDQIEALRAFVAVADSGSFTGAGQRLGRSTKLVSNHVAALESRFETQLFQRTTRSVQLTDAGLMYLTRCRAILEQWDELGDVMQDQRAGLKGPIRVTAPTGFGSVRLPTALAPFLAAHPGIELDLYLTNTRVSLVEEGIDLAIRIGRPQTSSLRMRKLADMPMVISAAPSYLAGHGTPATPEDLADHNCLIDGNQSEPGLWRFRSDGDERTIRVNGPHRINAPAGLAAMAQAGLGIIRAPLYAVEDALADGRLVELFADQRAGDSQVSALYPPNRHLPLRIRALIDHLAATLNA